MKCTECGSEAQLLTGKELYPHRSDLTHVKAWDCPNCGARIGCHDGTDKPKGTFATASMRRMRMKAHKAFDELWQEGPIDRKEAYTLLARFLNLHPDDCHIGKFTEEGCEKVLQFVDAFSYAEEYAYPTIKDYQKITNRAVNDAFKIGWDMARTRNRHLGIYTANDEEKEIET